MMDPILEQFTEEVRKVRLLPPRVPFISSSTGKWITEEEATDPIYWTMQIRQPVRFHAARQELAQQPDHILLEVGPGRALGTLARHPSYHVSEQVVLSSLGLSRETHKDFASLLTALGQLWLEGVPVNWQGFYARERRCRVPLPTYPFERKRYWIDPPTSPGPRAAAEPILQPLTIESPKPDEVLSHATVLEKIMSEQLQVMARQLEVMSYCQPSHDGAEAPADSTSLLPGRVNGCSQSKDETVR